jgi:hypothetical protein
MNCSSKHFGSLLVVPAAEKGAQGKCGADGPDGVNLQNTKKQHLHFYLIVFVFKC